MHVPSPGDAGEQSSTERLVDDALRASEELHRITLASISDTVVLTDDEGKIRYVCPNVAVIFGYSPEEVMALGTIDRLLGSKLLAATAAREGELTNIDCEITAKDGTKRDLFVNVKRVSIQGGTLLYTCRDVSKRKRAEALCRAVVADLTEMLVRWQPDGTCTFVNPAYCHAVGKRPEELLGTCLFSSGSAESRDAAASRIAVLTAASPVSVHVAENVLSNGKIRYEEWTDRGLFDADGRLFEVQSTGRDITERRRAEVRIRQLNRVYAVLSNINETIVREGEQPRLFEAACRIAVERGGFRMAWIGMVNPATDRLRVMAHAGASPDTLEVLDAIFEDPRRGCAFTAHALRAGEHAFCNDIALDPLAAPWREAALERGYRAMVALPITVKGEFVGTFNLYAGETGFFDDQELKLLDELALDIGFALQGIRREAERRRAEAARRESEERFRQLTETIQDVFWITTPARDKILYVSPAYEKIWDRTCESLYAAPQSWLEAVHPEDRDRVHRIMLEPPPNDTRDEEYRIIRRNGEIRWIRDRIFFVRNEGGDVQRVVGVARDVTERRNLEEQFRQAQKMDGIGQLAGGVAHDFNNILAAVLMQADLAAMDPGVPTVVRTQLEQIRSYAERAANLTRQLLLFSRRQVMQRRALDLNELVTNLVQMLRRIIGEDIRLVLDLSSAPLRVLADAGMLDQVLLNLTVNSRDAMPQGGQLVIATAKFTLDEEEARRRPNARPGDYACLRVTDTGQGIPPEILPRIFEPFFTTKPEGKGTGLGLATVFGIVEQHHGRISAESEPDKGTSIRVCLPVVDRRADTLSQPGKSSTPRGGSETVLVVEDEEGVRVLLRAVLERHGYRVVDATSGDEALRHWQAHGRDAALLVTDLVMPGNMNGLQLARRMQRDNPELKVIFVSGYSADLAGRDIVLQPGENLLQKPFGPHVLLETVRRCLDQ